MSGRDNRTSRKALKPAEPANQLNWLSKGALAYRTTQFSKSAGCLRTLKIIRCRCSTQHQTAAFGRQPASGQHLRLPSKPAHIVYRRWALSTPFSSPRGPIWPTAGLSASRFVAPWSPEAEVSLARCKTLQNSNLAAGLEVHALWASSFFGGRRCQFNPIAGASVVVRMAQTLACRAKWSGNWRLAPPSRWKLAGGSRVPGVRKLRVSMPSAMRLLRPRLMPRQAHAWRAADLE